MYQSSWRNIILFNNVCISNEGSTLCWWNLKWIFDWKKTMMEGFSYFSLTWYASNLISFEKVRTSHDMIERLRCLVRKFGMRLFTIPKSIEDTTFSWIKCLQMIVGDFFFFFWACADLPPTWRSCLDWTSKTKGKKEVSNVRIIGMWSPFNMKMSQEFENLRS